jgi:hypothetical protein
MRKITLWETSADGRVNRADVDGLVALTRNGWRLGGPSAPRAAETVALAPARAGPYALSFVLVPDRLSGAISLNGSRLCGGMHPLRHSDRLDYAGRQYWVSASAKPEERAYDPRSHGEPLYCFRTKAPLQEGEPIVVCPGTPAKPCGMIYKASAWLRTLACHGCGYDPSQPEWTPPQTARRRLDELLKLAAKR